MRPPCARSLSETQSRGEELYSHSPHGAIMLFDVPGGTMTRPVFARVFALAGALLALAAYASDEDLSANVRLLNAARKGDVVGVEQCLKEGASPDSRSRIGET